MNVRHHPSLAMRSDYAAGNLAPGAALALALHLKLCPACAIAIETMGGASQGAGADAAARGAPSGGRSFTAQDRPRPARPQTGLFETLEASRAGPWWPAGRGLRIAALKGVSGLGEAVFLLKARPGARFKPSSGLEQLLVLEGSFEDQGRNYEAGDFVERAAESLDHPRVAGVENRCLLVADEKWPNSSLLRFALSRVRLARI